MNILADYEFLLNNPDADFIPKTYIFAAKAAPGYYLAKQIIKLIWAISEEIRKNPKISKKLSVYFLEDYRVTLSELLMPDFSGGHRGFGYGKYEAYAQRRYYAWNARRR